MKLPNVAVGIIIWGHAFSVGTGGDQTFAHAPQSELFGWGNGRSFYYLALAVEWGQEDNNNLYFGLGREHWS